MLNTLRQNLSPREHPIRFAIMMVLFGVAADRYVLLISSQEEGKDRRGAITGTLNNPAYESGNKSPAEPELGGGGQEPDPDDDELDFSQCRSLVFNVIGEPKCQEPSDEEITDRYLAREQEKLIARAEEIADELGIQNENDQLRIREQALRGCTEIGRITAQTLVSLRPSSPQECEDLELEKPLGEIWLAPKEQVAYEQLSSSEKATVDLYRQQQFDRFLKEAPLDSLLQRIEYFRPEDNANPAGLHLRAWLRSIAGLFIQIQEAYSQRDVDRICELLHQVEAFDPQESENPELKQQIQDLQDVWFDDPGFASLLIIFEFYENAIEAALNDQECPE